MYHILLILTDGEIHDFELTVNQIVRASGLPCSVIIVGVGDEEFEKMQELDGDNKALKNMAGQMAKRDVVQFVKLKGLVEKGQHAVAKQVLAEVPN